MTIQINKHVSVTAAAKINLYLHVVGRRANGYHELDSLIAFTNVFDTLTFYESNDLVLEIDGPFASRIPATENNLVLRAARALREEVGIGLGAHIKLQKDLPVAAGLGSGSADAAATLKGLVKLWKIEESDFNLKEIGFSLGTDIPACLISDTVHVGGVGEILEIGPKLPEVGVLLVNPCVTLSTPAVFQARRGGFSPSLPMIEPPKTVNKLVRELEDRSNDLTDPALRLAPVIREVLAALENIAGCHLARLSGSGATCFGLFDNQKVALAASKLLEGKGWWIRATKFRMSNS